MSQLKIEADVEKPVCKYAEGKGFLAYKFKAPGRAGMPDRIFLKAHGIIFFIEFKRPGEPPRKLQNYIHKMIRACGFDVHVVDDVELGKKIIDSY